MTAKSSPSNPQLSVVSLKDCKNVDNNIGK